jgi:hypothetical protein
VAENKVLNHLRIALSLCKPDGKTFIPLMGKQEAVVDDNMKREAEMNLWCVAPSCRRKKYFLMSEAECGVGPQCTEFGDLVVVMLGRRVPLVLRKRNEKYGADTSI